MPIPAPPPPYSVRIDPATARELAERGGAILLLGVPVGTLVGIDAEVFLTGPKFQGVKMVPPGVHVVSYQWRGGASGERVEGEDPGGPGAGARRGSGGDGASTGATAASYGGVHGPPTAFFVDVPPRGLVLRVADLGAERLVEATEEEHERWLGALRYPDVDATLAPYNLGRAELWRQLVGHVTPDVLRRVAPVGGDICGLAEPDPAASGRPPTEAERALEARLAAGRHELEGRAAGGRAGGEAPGETAGRPATGGEEAGSAGSASGEGAGGRPPAGGPAAGALTGRCFFTTIPRLVKRRDLAPAELSAANLDQTTALRELLGSQFSGRPSLFLGEFQLAFLAFLLAHSAASFAQWRAVIRLVLSSPSAAVDPRLRPLVASFLDALATQLVLSGEGAAVLAGPGTLGAAACGEGATPPSLPAAEAGSALAAELAADAELRTLAGRWRAGVQDAERAAGTAPREGAAAGEAGPSDSFDGARARFLSALQRELGWGAVVARGNDDDDDDDDDGPTVVDASELPAGFVP